MIILNKAPIGTLERSSVSAFMSSRPSLSMSSEEPGLVPQPQSGLSSQQLLFQEDPSIRFSRIEGDPGPKSRELGQPIYVQDRFFAHRGPEFRRSLYPDRPDLRAPKWSGGSDAPSGGDATDGNEEDYDDEDEEDVPAGQDFF